MSATLALLFLAILSGTLLTYLYDPHAPLAARLCAGACTGLALLALIGFLLVSFLGLHLLALLLAAAAVASPLGLLVKPAYRARAQADIAAAARGLRDAVLHPTWHATSCVLFYAVVSLLLWFVFDRALFERADGLYTGLVNNLGDLPFHLQVITSFAHGQNFPPEDPAYAGVRFAYPFFADFVAAMFVRGGASLRAAMLVQNLVLALALVGLLQRWTLEWMRDRLAGLLAPVLLLLSGGFGWWLVFRDLRESDHGLWWLLRQVPHDYTILPGSAWRWGNSLTTLLVPQRSFLFGLPLAICIFTQWWLALREAEPAERLGVAPGPAPPAGAAGRMAAAGAMAGVLPLIHTHTFAVVMGMGGCLALLFRRWREWAVFFGVALALGLPEILWVMHGSAVRAQSFFGWHFGWDRGGNNAVWFWLKNTGLFIPLLIAAILWRREEGPGSRRALLFYLPFTLCFVVPNVTKLAPWPWDNIKILFYWYVASIPLVAWLLSRLWQGRGRWRAAGAALIFALALAGGLDVWRVISRATQYREFDPDGMALAQQILRCTPPRAVILHAPAYNSPVFLTGRGSLLGYPGWIWSRGLEYASREADIRRIYAGAPDARALLGRYHVDYVLLGPQERAAVPINDAFLAQYAIVGAAGGYRLYKVARP